LGGKKAKQFKPLMRLINWRD